MKYIYTSILFSVVSLFFFVYSSFYFLPLDFSYLQHVGYDSVARMAVVGFCVKTQNVKSRCFMVGYAKGNN